MTRWIIVFIDGIGLTLNPQPPWTTARLPTWTRLLGAPPTATTLLVQPQLVFKPLDATLGVAGLPQSGTGHTTLWTGYNAAALLGRHFPAYPAPSQHMLLAEHNLFKQLVDHHKQVSIATVYREPYWELVAQRAVRPTAVALAARAARLDLPTPADYHAGTAVPWDITGAYLARWGAWPLTQTITPYMAAQRLLALSRQADLVHYECFLPDFVGHQRIDETPERVLELIDSLLGALLADLPATTHVVLVSDHGNLEAADHRRHTTNPVPLLVVGPAAASAASLTDLSQLTPWILGRMSS